MEVNVKSLLLLINLSILYLLQTGADDPVDACAQLTSCSCQNSKGVIDLTPLALTSGEPKFKDQQGAGGSYYYSWNPCNPFTENPTGCSGVAACQTDKKTLFFNLGTVDSAKFSIDPKNGLMLTYTATTDAKRTLDVILKCDPSQEAKLDVKGENPPASAIYEMTLTSKYACPIAGGGPSVTVGLTVGSIMVIIFFAVLVIYVTAGITFQVFVRKATGKEMAPNYGFWTAMPGLIKDGVLFTVKCGRHTSSYDQI